MKKREEIEEKYEVLCVGTGSTIAAAELCVKGSESPEAFLEGLRLLVSATMNEGERLLALAPVQRMFHRHVKKVFGVASLMEAIAMELPQSPVVAKRCEGKQHYSIILNEPEAPTQELSGDEKLMNEVRVIMIENEVEGMQTPELRRLARVELQKRGLPVKQKHLREGETLEGLAEQGIRVSYED
jgi:hypothetical protein